VLLDGDIFFSHPFAATTVFSAIFTVLLPVLLRDHVEIRTKLDQSREKPAVIVAARTRASMKLEEIKKR
jgi:hypothetical protein